MINYNKNALIDECDARYFVTFAGTLDVQDYVPSQYLKYIRAYIFKNMKKQFKKIDREDRRYQRELRRAVRAEERKAKKQAKQAQQEAEEQILTDNSTEEVKEQ